MNVGSTFSGVGGLDLGLERAGMTVRWQAEVDDWSRRVLSWHWPACRIYDDVRSVTDAEEVDLLCGGFPCQDLSVAGKRAGLAGERSGLFFEFARIADELRPDWIVVENVVGLLSSSEGRDFGIVLSTLGEVGYGCAWRVFDARFFGVPQRRRRVFIIGRFGDDGSAAVRALGAGGEGDLEAGECSWQKTSVSPRGGADRSLASGGRVVGSLSAANAMSHNGQDDDGFKLLLAHGGTTARSLTTSSQRLNESDENLLLSGGEPTLDVTDALRASGPPGSRRDDFAFVEGAFYSTGGSRDGSRVDGVSPTLKVGSNGGGQPPAVSFHCTQTPISEAECSPSIGETSNGMGVTINRTVRRLTPVECERLMSWPDGWTAVDGSDTPDGKRYAACGNGVVSNVSEWIGRRILAVERELGDA